MTRVDEKGPGIEHPSVDIELVLGMRAVAAPRWHAVAIARPTIELTLVRHGLAVDREHRLESWSLQTARVQ